MSSTRWLWTDPPLKRLRQLFCQHMNEAGATWPGQRTGGLTRMPHAYWCTDCGKARRPRCDKCGSPL